MASETRIGGDVKGALGVAVLLMFVASLAENTYVGLGLCRDYRARADLRRSSCRCATR